MATPGSAAPMGKQDLDPAMERDFLSTTAVGSASVAWSPDGLRLAVGTAQTAAAPFGHGLGRQHRQAGPRSQGEGGISVPGVRWEAARTGTARAFECTILGCLQRWKCLRCLVHSLQQQPDSVDSSTRVSLTDGDWHGGGRNTCARVGRVTTGRELLAMRPGTCDGRAWSPMANAW